MIGLQSVTERIDKTLSILEPYFYLSYFLGSSITLNRKTYEKEFTNFQGVSWGLII